MFFKSLVARLRRFGGDNSGSVSLEFILMTPLLLGTFMAAFIFFDGYRQSAVNLNTAYTISDLISRETDALTDEYIDSMYSLMGILTRATSPISLRVTVVRWDESDDRYYVDWSTKRGYDLNLTDATIGDIEDKLPVMPDNERVILVETSNTYVPLFNVGMGNQKLDNFVFTRPRFAPQLCASGSSFIILGSNC